MPASWQQRLDAAGTEAEVLSIARDFLADFPTASLALLPEPCRPPRLADGTHLAAYAFALVRHRYDDGVGGEYAVHRLSAFFAGATLRITQLRQPQAAREAARAGS